MPVEMYMLIAVSGVLLALSSLQGLRAVLMMTVPLSVGHLWSRDDLGSRRDRLNQAIRHLTEAIAVFAPMVLIIHMLGLHNGHSEWGAILFFVARVAHLVFFGLRLHTACLGAWFVSVISILMVGSILVH